MLKDDNRATRLLIQARQTIAADIKAAGGCDHSVGLCMCAETALIAEIDKALFDSYGINMMWKFFYAEPTQSGENMDRALTWAADARAAVSDISAELLFDITEHTKAPF